MLQVIINKTETFDNSTSEFGFDGRVIELEHSLVSLSKWESEFEKPFLAGGEKTAQEIFSYIHAMVLTPGVTFKDLETLDQEEIDKIQKYIDSKRSATTFGNMPERNSSKGETITSELIYYWMVAYNIPFECETWHLNRLFSLIRICNVKNSKPKKMSRNEIAQRNRELNAKRKAELGTSG